MTGAPRRKTCKSRQGKVTNLIMVLLPLLIRNAGLEHTPGHIFYAVALEEQLVLHLNILGTLHTFTHRDGSDDLLAKEVTNGELCTAFLCIGVDGEMGIYKAHLVPANTCNGFTH